MTVNTHVDTLVDTHVDTTATTSTSTTHVDDTHTETKSKTDTQTVLSTLVATASSWCSSHGVLMAARDRTTGSPFGNNTYYYEPAPFSLHPTPFPTTAFQTAYRMAQPFQAVVHNVASSKWLQQVLSITAQSDKALTGKLLQLAKDVDDREANGIPRAQRVVLGILRSDYMLHGPDSFQTAIPLQVELNTIAASFGCLSSKITTMHKHLQHLTHDTTDLPDNGAAIGIAKALARALEEYHTQRNEQHQHSINTPLTPAVVLMVVQPGETNSCDQRDLEFLLQQSFQVRLIRRTLLDLEAATYQGAFDQRELILQGDDGNDVAAGVVYYRAGYTPNDYPTELEWAGRAKAEHSAAIKCPDVFYHLVGAKKVQQALAEPGALGPFCSSKEEETLLSSCFARLYALGEGDDSQTVEMALANPHGYVLKPQREGGGNNLYDEELVTHLKNMTYAERGAYILMEKILPPSAQGSLVRGGEIVYHGDCVCELGVFGISLREYGGPTLMDEVVGHILRAKSVTTDEGGVAAGYAFLSSPTLV